MALKISGRTSPASNATALGGPISSIILVSCCVPLHLSLPSVIPVARSSHALDTADAAMAPSGTTQSTQIALIAIIIGLAFALVAIVAYVVSYRARLVQDEENKPLLSQSMLTAATGRSSNNTPQVSRTTDGTVDQGTNTDATIKQWSWYEGLTGTPKQTEVEEESLASTIKRKISRPILTAAAAARVFKTGPDDSTNWTKPSDPVKDRQNVQQPSTSDTVEDGPSSSKGPGMLKPSDIFKPEAVDEDGEANLWVTDLIKPTKGLVEAMKAKLNGSTHSGEEDQTIKARAQNDIRRYSTLYTIHDVANEPNESSTHAAQRQTDSKNAGLSSSAPPGAFPVSPKEQNVSATQTKDDKENVATKRKSKSRSSKLPRHRRQASKSEPNQDKATEAKLGEYVVSRSNDPNATPAVMTAGGPTHQAKRQSSAPNSSRIPSGGSSSSKSQSQRKRKPQKKAQSDDSHGRTDATETASGSTPVAV